MKFNAYLHASLPLPSQRYPGKAASTRRWWLGWLQLLCAWLLCVLLCANVALVLAKELPGNEVRSAARKPVDCALAQGTPKPVVNHGAPARQERARTSRCRDV